MWCVCVVLADVDVYISACNHAYTSLLVHVQDKGCLWESFLDCSPPFFLRQSLTEAHLFSSGHWSVSF